MVTPEYPCNLPTNKSRECSREEPYACGECAHGHAAAAVLEFRVRLALPQVTVNVDTTATSQLVFADGHLMASVSQGAAKDSVNQLIQLTNPPSASPRLR